MLDDLGQAFSDLYKLTGGEVEIRSKISYDPSSIYQKRWIVEFGTFQGQKRVIRETLIDALNGALHTLHSYETRASNEANHSHQSAQDPI